MLTNLNVSTTGALGNGGLTTLSNSFDYQRHTQLEVILRDETDPLNPVDTTLVWEAFDPMNLAVTAGKFKITGLDATSPYEHGTGIKVAAVPTGVQRLIINRVTGMTQEVAYAAPLVFPKVLHEAQQDRQIMMLQEVEARVDSLEVLGVGEAAASAASAAASAASAAAAAASQSAAANSATNAAASAASALASSTAATASQAAAGTSAAAAATSETNAASSEAAAATDAANAAASAAAAATSETNAAASAAAAASAVQIRRIKTVSADYSVLMNDDLIVVEGSAAPVTITLLACATVISGATSKEFLILNNSAFNVSVVPQPGETVQRGASYDLAVLDDVAGFIPRGTNYHVL